MKWWIVVLTVFRLWISGPSPRLPPHPPLKSLWNSYYVNGYCVISSNMKFCHIDAAPFVIHIPCVAWYTCSFCIVLWTLFWRWILYQPWTLWHMQFRRVTMFPDAALLLLPMWCMHFIWQAQLNLFLLCHELFSKCELFSDGELFSDHELHKACTLVIILTYFRKLI